MRMVFFLLLLFTGSVFADSSSPVVPFRFQRFPFTGEAFGYGSPLNNSDEESGRSLLRKLFEEGRVQFKYFQLKQQGKIDRIEFGSKVGLGYDHYEVSFPSKEALYAFVKNDIKDAAPYNMGQQTIYYGMLEGVRDYALRTKDKVLMQHLIDKQLEVSYTGSANENKEKIYAPLLKAIKK